MIKTKKTSGADELTPSVSQYFSWINSTNEGSTEKQTLINLEYFKWLKDTYGMQIKIYAWDAGNLDGAGFFDSPDSPKIRKQYPKGYGPCVEKAKEIGIRMGIWGGVDGFGDTPEEEEKRKEIFIGLCRDFNFYEFKFDTVCSSPREEKLKVFKEMIDKCREYSPDLIVLNHRNNLGEAEIAATTFLLEGAETYTDVLQYNTVSGPHHRVSALSRNLVPGMQRLAEDHGVCISSFIDYFDDELIIQAFSRNLILAPEIYGNPWLMSDYEQAKLARIYNIHEKYNDILVRGFALDEDVFGKNAVSRGNDDTRLLTFANSSWDKKTVTITIGSQIGLPEDKKEYAVKTIHPYEEFLGFFKTGETVDIEISAARSALIIVQEKEKFLSDDYALTGCRYETVYGKDRIPSYARIYKSNGNIGAIGKVRCLTQKESSIHGDNEHKEPVFLGELKSAKSLGDFGYSHTRSLYETTAFAADTDSLEAQSLKRAGKTEIPEVQAARDAFFSQDTYIFRGTEEKFLFDGNDKTFYDAETQSHNTRIFGGCLRIDYKNVYNVSKLEIEFFTPKEAEPSVPHAVISEGMFTSKDLKSFETSHLLSYQIIGDMKAPVVTGGNNLLRYIDGTKIKVTYKIDKEMRYIGIPNPMGRIYSVKILDCNNNEIKTDRPHANNTLGHFDALNFKFICYKTVTIPENISDESYIAIGHDGDHGFEGAYSAIEFDGKIMGAYERACCYPMNNWEYIAASPNSGLTYYFKITDEMKGKEVTLYSLSRIWGDIKAKAWICDKENKQPIGIVEL